MSVNKILFPSEKGYDVYDLWRDVYSQNYENPNYHRIIIHLLYQYITYLHYYDDISNKILYRKNKFKKLKNIGCFFKNAENLLCVFKIGLHI